MATQKTLNYKDVSIVMISMNEEGAIKNVLQDISKDAPGAEIILVDSSKDKIKIKTQYNMYDSRGDIIGLPKK